jgi:hypothetical protein
MIQLRHEISDFEQKKIITLADEIHNIQAFFVRLSASSFHCLYRNTDKWLLFTLCEQYRFMQNSDLQQIKMCMGCLT